MRWIMTLPLLAALSCDAPSGDIGTEPDHCEQYQADGRPIADEIWENDWPVVAPLFSTEADAEADEALCSLGIHMYGAEIQYKPEGHSGATALAYVVYLPPDHDMDSAPARAARVCHELMHIIWQWRVGVLDAAIQYGGAGGRLTTEGTAYALGDLVRWRHGRNDAYREGTLSPRRANWFPGRYLLEGIVNPQCVEETFNMHYDEIKGLHHLREVAQ